MADTLRRVGSAAPAAPRRPARPCDRRVYGPADWAGDPARDLGQPGEFPFTRGVYPTMYTGRLWTMRQYAGFGTARGDQPRGSASCSPPGRRGLSTAFDLPTQMGYDSDHPMAQGEVGRVGVAIDTVDDLARSLPRHPARPRLHLDDDQRHGGDPARDVRRGRARSRACRAPSSTGTVQNDVLKEYIARGTYIYPARAVAPAGRRHLPLRAPTRA